MPADLDWTRRSALAGGLGLIASAAQAAPPLALVASFSVLADITRQLAGPRASVDSLVAVGADAHHFEPRASDARALAAARGFIVNGLGFEPWAQRLAKGAGFRGALIVASAKVKPVAATGGHAHDGQDPHAWLDVANARAYAAQIVRALIALDPADAEGWRARLAAYDATLAALDAEILAILAPIPWGRRVIVTPHGAFGYFGRAYGLRVLAAQGLSTAVEPNAAQMGRLVRQLRAEKIPAIFAEGPLSDRLVARIEAESGAKLGGRLYADTLSPPGGPAPSYIEMMRHNARTIAAGLISPR